MNGLINPFINSNDDKMVNKTHLCVELVNFSIFDFPKGCCLILIFLYDTSIIFITIP